MSPTRAWVLLSPSRNRLNLLDPSPDSWTTRTSPSGLSRTYRWGGHSAWDLPLSVAQHSLTVLALRCAMTGSSLGRLKRYASCSTIRRGLPLLRLHYAGEAVSRGRVSAVVGRLQAAVAERYHLPAWTPDEHARHKHADRLAAASEARCMSSVGARMRLRHSLEICGRSDRGRSPAGPAGPAAVGSPGPPNLAAHLFLAELRRLCASARNRARRSPDHRRRGGWPCWIVRRLIFWPPGSIRTLRVLHKFDRWQFR